MTTDAGAAQSGKPAAAAEQPGAKGTETEVNTAGAGAGQQQTNQPEPTVADDGFTDEERAQFAAMERGEAAPAETGKPAEGASADGADGAKPGEKAAGAEEDEDDDADPADAAAADGKPGEQQRTPKRVNYGKFARMAERAKTAEEKARDEAEKRIRLEERLTLINEALTPKQVEEDAKAAKEDPEPDPDKDVFGWIAWSRRDRARMQARLDELSQTNVSTREEREVQETYVTDVRSFAQKEPNFGPAYQFLMQSRVLELAAYNYDLDLTREEDAAKLTPEMIKHIQSEISAEERGLVENALKARKSPAAAIFRMARMRGFRPATPGAKNGAAGDAAAANGDASGKGKAPGALDAGADGGAKGGAAPSVKEEIDRLKRGSAEPSLSSGGGAPRRTGLPSATELINMSTEDFGALLESLSESQQAQLLGG